MILGENCWDASKTAIFNIEKKSNNDGKVIPLLTFFKFSINNAFKTRAKILRKHRQKVQKIQKLREAKDHWEGFFLPLILTKEDTLSMKKWELHFWRDLLKAETGRKDVI